MHATCIKMEVFRYIHYGTLMRPESGAAATVFPRKGSDIWTSSEIDK